MSAFTDFLRSQRRLGWGIAASLVLAAGVEGLVLLNPDTHAYEKYRTAGFSALALGWAFVLALFLLRKILSLEFSICAVARVTLEEALRMRAAILLLGAIGMLLVVLPASLDAETPLRFRIQTFLSYAISGLTFLLSLMTIFLASGGLSGEIEDYRIFNAMSKPISRAQFLIGKWLGVFALDAMLILVGGLGIYVTALGLSNQTALDKIDRRIVDNELLTARESSDPQPPEDLAQRVAKRWQEYQKNYAEEIQRLGADFAFRNVQNLELNDWLSIAPMEEATFIFKGLPGPEQGKPVQFRYKFFSSKAPPDGTLTILLVVNNIHKLAWKITPDAYEVLTIPAKFLSPDGHMQISITNRNPAHPNESISTTLTFPTDKGIEVLYEVSSFGPNLARSLSLDLLKLAFLSALGLLGAAYLSFPVACLKSLVLYVLALSSDFILSSMADFKHIDELDTSATVMESFKYLFVALGTVLRQFSRFDPTAMVVQGRFINWNEIARGFFWIGMVYAGVCLLLAWVIFQRRELARQ